MVSKKTPVNNKKQAFFWGHQVYFSIKCGPLDRIAAKIIANLDLKHGLWMTGSNPVLHNVHDYLIEEASAEEEELLKKSVGDEDAANDEEKERDIEEISDVLEVLDKMIMYLRIVHSTDLYGGTQYEFEDEIKNR